MSDKVEHTISRYGLPRSSLACLACRNAKSKCDGLIPSAITNQFESSMGNSNNNNQDIQVQAEISCSRCSRLHLECLWKPCQRTGRPAKRQKSSSSLTQESARKKLNVEEENSIENTGISFDSIAQFDDQSSIFSDETVSMLSQLLNEPLFLDEEIEVSNQTNEESTDLNDNKTHEAQPAFQTSTNQLMEIGKRIHKGKTTHTLVQNDKSPSNQITDKDDDLELGILRFFDGVGLALPLYDSKEELQSDSILCEALPYITAALGHTFFEGFKSSISIKIRTKVKEKVSSSTFIENLMLSTDPNTIIAHLSALLFMIYMDYAMNDRDSLSLHLNQARSLALSHSLNKLDDGSEQNVFNSIKNDDQNMEKARKVWWELFIIDCIMDVMSNGKMKRQFGEIKTSVQFPGKEESISNQIWNLRVRSVSLLIGAFSTFKSSKDQDKLRSADTIQANVIAEAQSLLLTSIQARKSSTLSASNNKSDWSLQRRQVILFDCLMMLYAGRVHLHRLFWFSDLTLNLNSCSFQREGQASIQNLPFDDNDEQQQSNAITFSVEKIVQSSDSILQLMQIDSDSFFQSSIIKMQNNSTELLPITSSHWPPIGCCQMVASYGLAIHLAANLSLDSQQQQHQKIKDHSSDQALRSQQSISSIGLAEASLGTLSQVWPIAANYREEVHVCRLIINQSLPIS